MISGEAAARDDRRVQRCINQARFPVLKTLDQFDWNWPTKINRLLIQNLFHLDFVKQSANVVFISGTGLGKSHLMTALGHAACQRGHSVLFTGAIEIINTLADAQASGSIKRAMHHYIKPRVLCIDELGYLPIDKFGADCLFQILSHRYERGATLITTNRVYKQWATIFNNDAVLTSALLDRLLRGALLADALIRASHAEIAACAMVVDAKGETAAAFYRHHGFLAFEARELTYSCRWLQPGRKFRSAAW